MPQPSEKTSYEHLAAWLVAIPLVAIAVFLAAARDFQIGYFLPDDAFYYLKIAENAARGSGLSFDGLHATNGFQFLWQMMLVPLVWIARVTSVDPLVLVPFVEAALIIVGALVLLATLRRLGAAALPSAVGILIALFNPLILKPLFSAMETAVDFAVLSCLFCLLALIATRRRPLDRRAALLVGALGVLAMLCRFDNLVMLPAVALAFWAADKDSWFRRSLQSAGVVATGLVAYLAWNQLAFGIPLPVSGAIKSWQNYPQGFAFGVWAQRVLDLVKLLAVPAVVLAVVVGAIWLLRSRGRMATTTEDAWLGAFAALFAGIGLHVAYFVFYMQLHIATFWYYVPEFLAIAVLAAWISNWLAVRSKVLAVASLVVLVVLPYALVYSRYTFDPSRKTRFKEVVAVGRWVDSNLPKDAVIGSWNAGAVSYFSNRTVVNLDGLVNNAEYFRDYLRTGKTAYYLKREKIGYVVEYFQDPKAVDDSGLGYKAVKVFPYNIDERSFFQRGGTSHAEYYIVAKQQ